MLLSSASIPSTSSLKSRFFTTQKIGGNVYMLQVANQPQRDVDSTRQNRPVLQSETYVPRTMPSVLGHRDMFFMYVCALFLMTNAVLSASGGAVSLLYLIGGALFFFVPSVVAAIQLGYLFPHEGSLYNWTYHALGTFWSIFVGLLYWVTGILAVITGCDAFVTVLQGLNNAWLPDPWQQGLVILGVMFVATLICFQRMRTVQNVINSITIAVLVSVALLIIGAIVWLLKGHPAQTNFFQSTSWSINPSSYFFIGIITLNFIGASGPLTLAGEFRGAQKDEALRRSIIVRHLTWGSLCVFALYFLVSLSVLIVRGQAMSSAVVLPFEGFTAVDVSLGKTVGDVAVLGFLLYCFVSAIFYSTISSRILMAASIDRHLPIWLARLNTKRIPQNALLFQFFFAAFIVIVVFVVAPLLIKIGGSAANTSTVLYNVLSASLTLVWTIATLFFFIDIIALYRQNAQRFAANRAVSMWFLWLSVFVGGVACIITIALILVFSWIPTLLQDNQWALTVGGLAFVVIAISGGIGVYANSEASWQDTSQTFSETNMEGASLR